MLYGFIKNCEIFSNASADEKVKTIRWLVALKPNPVVFFVLVVLIVYAKEVTQKLDR